MSGVFGHVKKGSAAVVPRLNVENESDARQTGLGPDDGLHVINPRLRLDVRKAAIRQDSESFLIDFKHVFRQIDMKMQGSLDEIEFRRLCVGLAIDLTIVDFDELWIDATPKGEQKASFKDVTTTIYQVLLNNKQNYDVASAEAALERAIHANAAQAAYNAVRESVTSKFNTVNRTILAVIIILPLFIYMIITNFT